MKGIFVGMCGLDMIYYDGNPLPKENTKGKYHDYGYNVGGPATNAAVTYAALAKEATLVTVLGNSSLAVMIKAMLREYGVKVIDLADSDRKVNVSAIYVNTATGSRTILSGQNPDLPDVTDVIIPDDGDFIEYDGSLPGIEKALLKTGLPMVLDMGSDKESFLKCLTDKTTAITSEVYSHDGKNIFELNEEYQLENCARSCGDKPIEYLKAGRIHKTEMVKVRACDTLGAGDILHGAYCYYRYNKKLPFAEALKKAGEFASYSTEKYGVVNGIRHALEKMVED